jgi:hypothetical protein
LPEPEGPVTACRRPACSSSPTPSSAVVSPKRRTTPFAEALAARLDDHATRLEARRRLRADAGSQQQLLRQA